MRLEDTKARLIDEIDERRDLLLVASHEIHAHPELCFEEHFAHDLLTDVLRSSDVEVESHAFGLDTAFVARAGSDGPNIVVCCEYDALPEIGHACGHNIIAAAGLGAGLAAAALADELGGRVTILGTPAEEGGGGKIEMIRAGALDGVDAALMVHPAGADLDRMAAIAIHQIEVDYHGVAAHAAAAPHRGRNALDAAVIGYTNVAALRQHIEHDERIHGIFTRAGDKPNIVPEHTSALWYVRSGTLDRLEPLKERVLGCLHAGATATGCTMEHRWLGNPYAEMDDNQPLVDLYADNAAQLGRPLGDGTGPARVTGSTDMGNVSKAVPSIHPMIQAAPEGTAIHTAEFATHAAGPQGDRAAIDGAKLLAMTLADLWLRPEALDRARAASGAPSGVRQPSGPPA